MKAPTFEELLETIASHKYELKEYMGDQLSIELEGVEVPMLLIDAIDEDDRTTSGAIEMASEGIDYLMYRLNLTRAWWNGMKAGGKSGMIRAAVNDSIEVFLNGHKVFVSTVDGYIFGIMLNYEPIWHADAVTQLSEAGVTNLIHYSLTPTQLKMYFASHVVAERASGPIASLMVSNGTTGHVSFSWRMAILTNSGDKSFEFKIRSGRKLHLKGTTGDTVKQVKEAIDLGIVESIQTALDTMEVSLVHIISALKDNGYKVDSKKFDDFRKLEPKMTLGTAIDSLMTIDVNAAQLVFEQYERFITF